MCNDGTSMRNYWDVRMHGMSVCACTQSAGRDHAGGCSREAHYFVAGAAACALYVLMSALFLPSRHKADVQVAT